MLSILKMTFRITRPNCRHCFQTAPLYLCWVPDCYVDIMNIIFLHLLFILYRDSHFLFSFKNFVNILKYGSAQQQNNKTSTGISNNIHTLNLFGKVQGFLDVSASQVQIHRQTNRLKDRHKNLFRHSFVESCLACLEYREYLGGGM